ncbi:CLUMA_CG003500, isoform A [Clunio marinus]|uniref:CLUMA_CG003500, isoform A n=1 Tax=Clunio marinus TaxID=568069 RepID=A0A1J1HP52_9DIPT|nr:CLUMA_CG003500, isoform A [Clunio marinus]
MLSRAKMQNSENFLHMLFTLRHLFSKLTPKIKQLRREDMKRLCNGEMKQKINASKSNGAVHLILITNFKEIETCMPKSKLQTPCSQTKVCSQSKCAAEKSKQKQKNID